MSAEPHPMLASGLKMLCKAFGSQATGEDVDALLVAGMKAVQNMNAIAKGGGIDGRPFPGLVNLAAYLERIGATLDAGAAGADEIPVVGVIDIPVIEKVAP